MHHLRTEIDIQASPEAVREKFLDFSKLPVYHKDGFFKSISTSNPDKPLEPGDEMTNELKLMVIKPTFLENSPTCFRWKGTGLLGTFNGEHIFRFEGGGGSTPGSTTFVHEEKFTGLLSFLMGDNFVASMVGLRDSTREGFEGFNRDLKAWCER